MLSEGSKSETNRVCDEPRRLCKLEPLSVCYRSGVAVSASDWFVGLEFISILVMTLSIGIPTDASMHFVDTHAREIEREEKREGYAVKRHCALTPTKATPLCIPNWLARSAQSSPVQSSTIQYSMQVNNLRFLCSSALEFCPPDAKALFDT